MQVVKVLAIFTFLFVFVSCSSGGGDGNNTNSDGPNQGSSPGSSTVDNLGSGDVVGNEYFTKASNSALLSGPTIGLNEDANVDLRKGVPFEVTENISDGIVAERVVIVREEFEIDRPFVVAYIRNTSDSIKCGILFDDIQIVHKDGETLDVVSHVFWSGSTGVEIEDSDDVVYQCLEAGDSGYHVIAGSRQGFYDEVDLVRFSLASDTNISDSVEYEDVSGTVLPVSYTVEKEGGEGSTIDIVSVSIQNNLERTITVFPPNVHALDEKGQPIMYSASGLETTVEEFTLTPGETKAITVLMYLTGQSSSIRASVSFRFLD